MSRIAFVAVTALIVSLVGWAPAQAQNCPPASVGGRAVAVVTVGGKQVPVKAVTFVNGGPLLPPATNKAAGISVRNRSLDAKKGATVITWHVRFGPGCPGALNALTRLPIGSTFTAGKVGGPERTYRIATRETVRKGTIKASWFRHGGKRKIVFITCADFAGGVFRGTTAVVAVPAPPPAVVVPHGAAPVWRGRASL